MRRRTEIVILALATAQLLLAWALVLPQLAGRRGEAAVPAPAVLPPTEPAPAHASEAEEPEVPRDLGPTVPHA